MNTLENIVVAAALDRRDATTIRHAARLANAFHAKSVTVAHVEPPLDWAHKVLGPTAGGNHHDRPAEERLQRLVDEARGSFPVSTSVQAAIRYGARVPELLKIAADQHADLLVLGRRPRDEHDAVSDAVVKLEWKSPCSVLIIPEDFTTQCERILVACDFSEHSREALAVAAALARTTPNCSLVIEHVYTLPAAPLMSGRSVAEMSAAIREEAQRRWDAFISSSPLVDVRHTLRLEEADNVPNAITRAAIATDSQLIVVGSHGLSPRAGALLGHVADSVCARTARPFLCVKRKGEVVGLLQALLGIFER
jgi:nucleotide-binding universal stress UspA family protein